MFPCKWDRVLEVEQTPLLLSFSWMAAKDKTGLIQITLIVLRPLVSVRVLVTHSGPMKVHYFWNVITLLLER